MNPVVTSLPQTARSATDRLTLERVASAWQQARETLCAERQGRVHWVGQLSTSALSTATAVSAWSLVRRAGTQVYQSQSPTIDHAIVSACDWLAAQQNADGGFGDTDRSHSNIATTLLVLAAWQLAGYGHTAHDNIDRAWRYVERVGKWDALRRRYGTDKTFVAPILTNCALAGIVSWDQVPTLPFEAAWLPQRWYRLARMPVVSYAVPALVAIGQAKHYHRPLKGPWKWVRDAAIEPTLQVLQRMQPASGGYLEAAPLTSFVLMCLADMQLGDHPVAVEAVKFLLDSRLPDGSLPIDTNLATWTTSLSISAVSYDPISIAAAARASPTPASIRWLLSCQHWSDHPFTGASPGGWGWSNLSGAVPDADDTPAALLALARWLERPEHRTPLLSKQIEHAAAQGLTWLLNLQNGDGGWPTFCKGWGRLPFDRSGSDLTAHALRALHAWRSLEEQAVVRLPERVLKRIPRAAEYGFRFLQKKQNADGSWFPLWFGNQDHFGEENPVYGTAKVLMAYGQWSRYDEVADRAGRWLVENQNTDGGWGGGASVTYRAGAGQIQDPGSTLEETGWVLESLLASGATQRAPKATIMRGLEWLVAAIEAGHMTTSWPIGFYFAKLWYHERLYPMIASTAALGAALEQPQLWQTCPD